MSPEEILEHLATLGPIDVTLMGQTFRFPAPTCAQVDAFDAIPWGDVFGAFARKVWVLGSGCESFVTLCQSEDAAPGMFPAGDVRECRRIIRDRFPWIRLPFDEGRGGEEPGDPGPFPDDRGDDGGLAGDDAVVPDRDAGHDGAGDGGMADGVPCADATAPP